MVKTASIKEAESCRSFVVFDTETTGLYPDSDKIIEIGAVRFRDGRVAERFDTFVNPGIHIPVHISDLTHITDDMVADAPDISEALRDFEAFVGGDPLVGHNIEFDLGFIHSAGSRLPDENRLYIDTAELARKIVKGPDKVFDKETGKWNNDYNSRYEVKSHSLGPMCEFYGLEHGELHRADEDAMMTGRLLLAMMADRERVRKASLSQPMKSRN